MSVDPSVYQIYYNLFSGYSIKFTFFFVKNKSNNNKKTGNLAKAD